MKFHAQVLAPLALALLGGAAHAAQVCPPDPDGVCNVGETNKFCPILRGTRCTKTALNPDGLAEGDWLITAPLPPGEVQVTCLYVGGGYQCDAWPKSPDASYAWTKFGNVQWANPPYIDDTATITCTPGMNNRVNVTVTSPGGFSEMATEYVYCGYAGEY